MRKYFGGKDELVVVVGDPEQVEEYPKVKLVPFETEYTKDLVLKPNLAPKLANLKQVQNVYFEVQKAVADSEL